MDECNIKLRFILSKNMDNLWKQMFSTKQFVISKTIDFILNNFCNKIVIVILAAFNIFDNQEWSHQNIYL